MRTGLERARNAESGRNHERWVISYADMVTLLFALFVVLYAMGETRLKEWEDVMRSIRFAFAFEGEGKTEFKGDFQRGQSGGPLDIGYQLATAQDPSLRRELTRSLPEEFVRVTGVDLAVEIVDDTIAFTAPLSAFFAAGALELRPDLSDAWLGELVVRALRIASRVRVVIRTPDVRMRRLANGTWLRSETWCARRLSRLLDFVLGLDGVEPGRVSVELGHLPDHPGSDWEDTARLSFAFTVVE